MKTLYITDKGGAIIIDAQNNTAKTPKQHPDRISRMLVAEEPLEIRAGGNKSKQTVLKAETGDLILTFYNSDEVVVVKNKDWKNKVAGEIAKEAAEREEFRVKSNLGCESCPSLSC